MRRVLLGLAAVAAVAAPGVSGSSPVVINPMPEPSETAIAEGPARFTIVVTDEQTIAQPPEGETVRWGLLVYPEARAPVDLAQVLWRGADAADGIAGTLGDIGLGDLGDLASTTTIEQGAPGLALAFAANMDLRSNADPDIEIVVTGRPWEWLQARTEIFVIGVSDRLPTLMVTRGINPPGDALLDPTGPGHPGIVSPFDLTASIARVLGEDLPDGYPGQVLATSEHPEPRAAVDALAERLRRDTRWPFPVAVTMIVLLLMAAAVTAAAVRLVVTAGPHAARLGQRIAASAAVAFLTIPLGYVVALFLPAASGFVRSTPILLAAAIGAVLAFIAERKTASIAVGRIGNLLVVAIVTLTIVSAARPGMEPALSFWDSPLVSFRVAGLRNALGAFIIGGLLVAFGTRRLHRAGLLLVGAVAVVVMGAPWLGANFVAVLAVTAGVLLALEVESEPGLRPFGAAKVFVVSGIVTVGSLMLDRSDATHAGRLVDATEARGIGLLVDIFRSRIQTNLDRVAEVGAIAWIGSTTGSEVTTGPARIVSSAGSIR
jgi:hypothetical protein